MFILVHPGCGVGDGESNPPLVKSVAQHGEKTSDMQHKDFSEKKHVQETK